MIMRSYFPILTLPLLQLPSAFARTFTVVNTCTYTIWPAVDLHRPYSCTERPAIPNGMGVSPSTSAQFTVPDNWKSGRIWGRRNCNFTTDNGPTSCLDGGCNGGLQCDPHSGTGTPPATVAEWTLQGNGSNDFYDVSVVDGFNIPMMIIPSANCSTASCPADLNPGCPAQLVGPTNSSGNTVGCKSACDADLDNNPTNSSNCCTGSHNTNATCPSSGVQYYSYFKSSCPNSYVYAFDESSGTALWTCSSSLNSDYRLTFCPPPYGGQAPAPISAVPASLIPSATFGVSSTSSRTQSASGSASHSPGFKSGALAPLRFPMAPGALSVLGVIVGWLVVMM
ncbi:thaumatin family-domain-containing protein [Russula vinacea]|nr:thaumatin family-domain-containing protein [Russula vinacea]